VNIQRHDEFACLQLNRDVWANETVKEVCRSSFLLWQQLYTDVDVNAKQQQHVAPSQAQVFVERYNVTTFPHVSILDPRTGLQVRSR
jgi:hypothetical protein